MHHVRQLGKLIPGGANALYPGAFVDFKQNNSGINSRPPVTQKEKRDTCILSLYLLFIYFNALRCSQLPLYSASSCFFPPHIWQHFPFSIISLLLIISCRLSPLVSSLSSHSVQLEATCRPSRSRSVRLP